MKDSLSSLYKSFNFSPKIEEVSIRIDKFLVNHIKDITRNKIQSFAKLKNILVNGKVVKSNYRIKAFDTIKILIPVSSHINEIKEENITLDIIYEDKDLIVINKPAGIVVHPGNGNLNGTLVNALKYYFNKHSILNPPILVHRIDKNTSGLLVIPKNKYTLENLIQQFSSHNINRKYLALVWGDLTKDNGTIIGNIGRNLHDRKKMNVFPKGDYGKYAITHYKVIERFQYVTLVICRLETGRTHQIRIHFKYIGHPIFNDNYYGGDKILKGIVFSKYKSFVNNCFKQLPRQALHAISLGFIHPISKKYLYFKSPIPEDMHSILDKWRNLS